MKKRILALFLGGVLAAGSLAMQMPVTAWAITTRECNYDSEPHIKSYAVTAGDGQITVAVDMEFENQSGGVNIYLFERELVKEVVPEADIIAYPVYDQFAAEGYQFDLYQCILPGDTYTFTGLINGKTYYVYAEIVDYHGYSGEEEGYDATHYAMYLGSYTPTAGGVPTSTTVPTPEPTPVSEASTVTVPTPEPTPTPEPVPAPTPSIVPAPTIVPNTTVTTDADSIKAVAAEVLKGKWGVGKERKIKLEAAGYDYDTVQKTVAQIMK